MPPESEVKLVVALEFDLKDSTPLAIIHQAVAEMADRVNPRPVRTYLAIREPAEAMLAAFHDHQVEPDVC